MSKKLIQSLENVDVCDWCDDRMDKYDIHDGKYHEPIKASIVSGYISHPTSSRWVNKFYFFWDRSRDGKENVQYDFHSRCFDKMMKELLAYRISKSQDEKGGKL